MPKKIEPSKNEHQWPRQAVKQVECRKRDVVVRVSNWLRNRDEPAIDVEVYIGGVYDFNESKSFTVNSGLTKQQCKAQAASFAGQQIAKLL